MSTGNSVENEPLLGSPSPNKLSEEDKAKRKKKDGCTSDALYVVNVVIGMCPAAVAGPLKKFWETYGPQCLDALKKSRSVCQDNAQAVAILHGMMLVLYGGSWPTICLLLAFYSVYRMDNFWAACSKMQAVTSTECTPANAAKLLAQAGMLYVVFHAMWISSFISSAFIALAIEPYATQSVVTVLTKMLIEKTGELRDWPVFGITQAIRFVLVILSWIMPRMFGAIYMGLYGLTMLVTQSPKLRETLTTATGPGVVPLKTLVLWSTVLVGMLWQKFCGFQASFLHLFVPFGFILASTSFKISPETWRRVYFASPQNKEKKDPEDPGARLSGSSGDFGSPVLGKSTEAKTN